MDAHRRILAAGARPATLAAAASAGPDYGVEDEPDWRDVRWPEQLRAVTVAGRRVHLATLGSGDRMPLLLVHGLGARWQNWLGNMPRLASRRRVIALDLPGFGRSQLPHEPVSIPGYAQTLDRVCDLLELEAPIVAGHSLGGLVVAELALRFPERVGAIVLVDAACLAPREIHERGARLALEAVGRLTAALPSGGASALTRPRLRHLAFAAVIRHPTLIATDMLYELAAGPRPPATLAALAALASHDIADELEEIAAPALVIHGREDMILPCSASERLASLLPTAELEIFEDTGHLPMIERPKRFNDALERFVERLE